MLPISSHNLISRQQQLLIRLESITSPGLTCIKVDSVLYTYGGKRKSELCPKKKPVSESFRNLQHFDELYLTFYSFSEALTVSPSPAAIALNNSSQVIGTMPLIRKDKILFYYPFAYDPTGLQETFSFLKYIQYPGKCC